MSETSRENAVDEQDETEEVETTTVAEQQAAFDVVIGEARAMPKNEVGAFRLDDDLAFRNVTVGVKALKPHEALAGTVKGVPAGLPARVKMLALALLFACRRVALATGKTPSTVDLAQLRKLRQLMLTSLEAASLADLIDEAVVAKIVAGRGNVDIAQDCIDMAVIFRDNDGALMKSTPVTAAKVDQASRLGHEAREVFAAIGHAGAVPDEEVAKMVDDRNRIGALLQAAHKQLLLMGAVAFGVDEVKAQVPSLQSRKGLPKKKKKAAKAPEAPVA